MGKRDETARKRLHKVAPGLLKACKEFIEDLRAYYADESFLYPDFLSEAAGRIAEKVAEATGKDKWRDLDPD